MSNRIESLTGSIGLVLLMFMGREMMAKQVIEVLRKPRIVDEDVVYQYTKKLEKMKLLKVVRVEERKRGKPRILTANLSAVLNYLSRHSRDEFSGEDLDRLSILFTSIANNILDHYPNYLLSSTSNRNIGNLKWCEILSNFLLFCLDYIYSCWLLRHYPKTIESNLEESLRKLKDSLNSGKISKKTYETREQLIKISFSLPSKARKLESGEPTKIAHMMKNPQDIIEDTFAGKLFFASIALRDPQLAARLNFYRKAIQFKNSQKEPLN